MLLKPDSGAIEMKGTIFVGILVAAGLAASESAIAQSDFKLCKSTYALCTTATCTPIPGNADSVSCACEVRTGYSAGQEPCQAEKQTSRGTLIESRYFPVKSYAQCANDRPWAWCLDKSCIVDKNDPAKADCTCSVVKDQGPYVIITDTYSAATCTTGLYSSATVKQLDDITDFLKDRPQLKTFAIKVVNPPLEAESANASGR